MKFKVGDRVGFLGSSRTSTVVSVDDGMLLLEDDRSGLEETLRADSSYLVKKVGGRRTATKRKRTTAKKRPSRVSAGRRGYSNNPILKGARCYACDSTKIVGIRDRRPEGGKVELGCSRHADPSLNNPAHPFNRR